MLREAVSPSQADEKLQSLKGKCALVTGGTTGIGRATARLLARCGAKVFIYGRGEPDLQDALRELKDIDEDVFGTTADQGCREDLERVFHEIDDKLGGLDILINNAAVAAKSVTDESTEDWVYAIQTDVLGYMHCAELAVPRLRQRKGGWIVNVGSMSAKVREEGSDVYVTAKMAVRGFSDSLGKKLAQDMIHVTLVEPGLVVSEMNEMTPEQQIEKQNKLEMILGEDIGRTILFVLSQPDRCSIPVVQVRPILQKI